LGAPVLTSSPGCSARISLTCGRPVSYTQTYNQRNCVTRFFFSANLLLYDPHKC
jgi:hypothetical protein